MSGFASGCLGKLPIHGDFIRFNAAGAEVHELDHWIGEGVVNGHHELAGRWDSSFDAAPSARFIYTSPKTKRVVAGMFRPSVDRAGRRYPFLVYALVDPGALGADLACLPLALEPFVARALELAGSPDSVLNVNALTSSVEAMKFTPDIAEAKRSFGRFVLLTGASDFWQQDYGSTDDPRMFAATQSIAEGPETRPPASLGLRLPLSGGAAEVSFWLELTRRLNRAGQLPTLAIWSDASAEVPARLHFCFGELASRYFLPFAMPQRPDQSIRDLSGQGDSAASQRGKQTFNEVLSQGSLKLADLLQRLPRCKGL